MKTHSNVEIPVFQNLGTNRWYYHFNHSLIIDEEGISYSADTVVMSGDPMKEKVENALISPITDKGEQDEIYAITDTLDDDLSLIVSYTDDVYRSITRKDIEGLEWISNEVVKVGQVRTHLGVDYECLQSHITQNGWEPDKAPALWRIISSAISEWVQPTGAHDAYNIGDQVLFNGYTYESLIDANVWSPTGYPAGWKKL